MPGKQTLRVASRGRQTFLGKIRKQGGFDTWLPSIPVIAPASTTTADSSEQMQRMSLGYEVSLVRSVLVRSVSGTNGTTLSKEVLPRHGDEEG